MGNGTEASELETGISVIIQRPPEKVFAALTDLKSHVDWARGPEEIRDVSDDPAQLGTTSQQVHRLLGEKLVASMQVDAHEEKRRFGSGSSEEMIDAYLSNGNGRG